MRCALYQCICISLYFFCYRTLFFHCVLCSSWLDLEYTCTLNRVTFILSVSNRWEQELQQCLEADVDFDVGDFIVQHPQIAPRTIGRRHASKRQTLMKRLNKRAQRGLQSSSMASLNTAQAQAAKGARNTSQAQAAKGARNTPAAHAAKGARNTSAAQAAKGSAGGTRNTPQAQAAKGSTGGTRNTPQAQAAKGTRNTPQAQAAKGSTGGTRYTPESQRDKGIVGGHANTPEKQQAKASHPQSRGVIGAAKKELFSRKHKPPSHISLKCVREYWLDGLDVLYSPLFDALCHRCGQLLWGPVGAHKFLVSRDDSAVRTTNLFGVPPTDVITSAIFEFRNDLFANYVQYKGPPFRVPPRLHPTSIGAFKVFDTPVWHSTHRMYACLVCSKYRAKYDPINYGYELDGTTHYNVPTKLANLNEYQKRQIALGALYSNNLKHVDLRHRQWHHAIGTVGVGRKPSQHYNALYGFMTMKEYVLRDYQKPKDSAQNTRQMNQALLLLKKIHPFYSRFLAHYETLYRYLQNAASTMGTLTQRFFEDKYGKRLEYHLQDEYVAWAVECDAPRNIIPDFAPQQDRVGFMHRAPFQRAGGTVTAAAQSLANDTYLHFNDPKLEPCVWPDLYPGGVGGYKVGCGIGCAAYYRSRYLAFDERWRRDRWWSFFQVSKEMKNQLIWNQQNFKAQRGDRAEDITAEHLRAAKSSAGPKPPPKQQSSHNAQSSSQSTESPGQASQSTPCPGTESSTQSPSQPSQSSARPAHEHKKARASYHDGVDSMHRNLEGEGVDQGTAELNPYYRYGTYVPSKLVGTRSYWASRHLDLTAMSRELGKADLFITWTMNDNWADLQAAVQKGCRAGAVWPGQYPEGTRPTKPIQDGYDMEACVAFHKRVEIFKREFLAIGKRGPFGTVRDYWFRFEYQERGRVHLHGVVWCQPDSIPDDVICATMPRESDGYDPEFTSYLRSLYKECNMVHQCYRDKCFNIGQGRVSTKCKAGHPFTVPQHVEELDSKGVRLLYRRQEQEDACVVPHNRRLLVRLQCHNNVQRITSLGWELYLAKYLTKAAKSLTVPMNLSPNATDVERLLKLRSLGRMENGMMLLGIHQCRGSREVVWIPTDPWPKLGSLKRRKNLPEDDTSTDVWYLDRYDFYLELPDGLQLKYPDFYRYYRRTRRNPSEASALASNPAEDMANESLSSDSDDAVDGDRYKADPPDKGKERPYWWPSPPERMEREIRDNMGNKWRLRQRTAIPRWNFYLPYGEDAKKYFLQKILLSQPFTKEDHEQQFFSKDNVSKTYMEECILRGLFRGYEEEARETLNNAQARGYSVERLRLLAEVLRAEDIIDATFFNNYMSELDELNKHRAGDDEPMVADEAELDPQLAGELKAFMNANDPAAAETLVNALNHWQRMVFEIFVAHF